MMKHTFTRVFCAARNKRYMSIAMQYGFKAGCRLPDPHVYEEPYFVDNDFRNPDFWGYMHSLSIWQPTLATVLDWEYPEQEDEVMKWAFAAANYVSEVLIIPKVPGSIASIPELINGKPVRLAYSVPTNYGASPVPIEEFSHRPVHLLGGSAHAQLWLAEHMNVVSGDFNQFMLLASMGLVWSPFPCEGARNRFAPSLTDLGITSRVGVSYRAFEMSMINFDVAYQTGLYDMPKKWAKKSSGRVGSLVQHASSDHKSIDDVSSQNNGANGDDGK